MSQEPKDINYLLSDFDARNWANEFVAINPTFDEGTAIAWFANALMAGYDHAMRKMEEQ